jgi:hypothetical protein
VAAASDDPHKQLEWEARQRPRAGIAAGVGALALIGTLIGQLQLAANAPNPSGLSALQRGLHKGVDGLPSLRTAQFQYLSDHKPTLIALGVVGLIGALAAAWALGFLAVATRARKPELKRWVVYLPIVGGALVGLWSLLTELAQIQLADHFLSSARTVADARDVTGFAEFTQVLGLLGPLLLTVAYVLVSLNAMSVGLLTRGLGVVGVIAGALVILPVLGPLSPLFEIVFLAGFSLMCFNAWSGGIPPAWNTGRAEPWPARERVPRGRPKPVPAPEPVPAPPVSAGARRKRKKRH